MAKDSPLSLIRARRAALVVAVAGATALLTPVLGAEPVDFARDLAPIFERSCVRCHQPGKAKGDVSLVTGADLAAGEYVVPGKPDESTLLDLIAPEVKGGRPVMPKQGAPLAAEEVALVRRWIIEGARWPDGIVLRDRSKADATWWALQPLRRPSPPAPQSLPRDWALNPIDRFVAATLAEKGLSPSPRADRTTLIRRLTFDLTGLPPTPEELEAFLADERPDAWERLVDRLLASPRYGEHWGRHWLDVVRFGESTGFERNVILGNAWPFRDYVIRSLNDDKPFDQLALEHLAGDVIGKGNPAVEVGTAFLVSGPYDNVGNQDAAQAAQIRANTIDDMIRTVGETFLGYTIGCARCHDHKFDPVPQRDYYSLYATFAGVEHGSREIAAPEARSAREARRQPLVAQRAKLVKERAELDDAVIARAEAHAADFEARWTRSAADRHGTEEVFATTVARFVRLVAAGRDDQPDARAGFHIDEFEVWTASEAPRNVALASSGAKAQGQSRVAEDFALAYGPELTIDGKFGARWIAAGPELTIALARPERIARVVFSSDRNKSLGREHPDTTFVGDYRIELSLDGENWTEVAQSSDRRPQTSAQRRRRLIDLSATADEKARRAELMAEIDRTDQALAAIEPLPSWWVGVFKEAPGPFAIFQGGDPRKPGESVVAASPSLLDAAVASFRLPAEAPEAQRRLALARWLVGPENPLTPRVLANRLWHYHFGTGIVDTPSDFGFMGGRPTHPELLDWLASEVVATGWRLKPLHRLIVTSQTYQQSSLNRPSASAIDADSRLLWRFPPRRLRAEEIRDAMLAVAGVLESRMEGPGFRLYRYLEDNVATYVPLEEPGPATYRRAVYHHNARAAPVDLLSDFDCPDNAFAAPRRASTISPLQALTLMNNRFTLDMARSLAKRLERNESPEQGDAAIRRAFLLAYSRPPTPQEQGAAADFIRARGLRAFCRAILNSNEFLFLD